MEENTVVDVEPTVPTAEKRPIEILEDDEVAEPHLSKKPRNGRQLDPNLRRVAEIVLVMSTMTALRAGKKPSDAEVDLMAEARAKLVQICAGLAPKDIVGREGISSLIEDLGLHGKARDQKLGFRGPRLTIAEKLAQAKKKVSCTAFGLLWVVVCNIATWVLNFIYSCYLLTVGAEGNVI